MPATTRIALLLLLLGSSHGALAQAPPAETLYQVEILIFALRNGDRFEEDFFHGRDDERNGPPPRVLQLPVIELESVFSDSRFGDNTGLFQDAPAPTANDRSDPGPDAAAADPATNDPTAPAAPVDGLEVIEPWTDTGFATGSLPGTAPPPLPTGFRLADPETLELTASANRLTRAPYTLLGHVGWVQAGLDENGAVAIDLRQLGITNPPGTIELAVGRFFHVTVDLDYRDGSGSFWSASPQPGLAPLEYAQSYRFVAESGPLRRNQVKLLDHPLLGVLVMVKAAPEAEPVLNGESTTGGPAG